jgi:hypothetical protein
LEELRDLKLRYLLPLSEKLLGVESTGTTTNIRLEGVSHWPVKGQPLVSMRDNATSTISIPYGRHIPRDGRLKCGNFSLVPGVLNYRGHLLVKR